MKCILWRNDHNNENLQTKQILYLSHEVSFSVMHLTAELFVVFLQGILLREA